MNLYLNILMHHDHEGGCCGNHETKEQSGCCGNHGEKEHSGCCGNHDHNHEGCGGHHHKHPQTITLLMEDNTEVTCQIINYVKHNEKTYILLLHPDGKSVLIYEFVRNEDGSVYLDDVQSEEDYEAVVNIYTTFQQQQIVRKA